MDLPAQLALQRHFSYVLQIPRLAARILLRFLAVVTELHRGMDKFASFVPVMSVDDFDFWIAHITERNVVWGEEFASNPAARRDMKVRSSSTVHIRH